VAIDSMTSPPYVYQPRRATQNAVYERSVVAQCAHSPTLVVSRVDPCKLGANNNNDNSHDNVYGAAIMTKVIARVH